MTDPAPAGQVDLQAGDLLATPDGRVYRAKATGDGGLTIEPLLSAQETRGVLAIFTGAVVGGGGGAGVRDGGRGAAEPGR